MLCGPDHLLKSACQSLVPTASHEDQRGGGDSMETIRDFGLFSLHVNFFHIDLKAGNCLEKWQGREKALQAECIREGLQFADCCRERLRNPPQSVLCGRRRGEGSGRGAGVQRVRDGRSPGMCGRPLRGARAPSGSLSRRLLSSPFPNTDGHLTATRSAALRFSTTAEGISILIRMID